MNILMRFGALLAAIVGLFGFHTGGEQAPPAGGGSPIEYFCYSHSGSSTYDIYSYEVLEDEETGQMQVVYELMCGYETYTLPAEPEFVQELTDIAGKYGLREWDGFHESDPLLMDGYGFSLHIGYTDGTTVFASGSNAYPDGYSEAAETIDELFMGYLKKNGINPEGGYME